MGVSPRSLLTPSSQPQGPSSQPCSAFQVKIMSTYSLDLPELKWELLTLASKESTLLILLSLVYSPRDKSYVEKGFVNCVCPKCKALFLPYNLSSSPLSYLPPSTYQTVGAQSICWFKVLSKINQLDMWDVISKPAKLNPGSIPPTMRETEHHCRYTYCAALSPSEVLCERKLSPCIA